MKVFISYRREDTAAAAGRLYDRLCQILGRKDVFFDVSTIHVGENFKASISSALSETDAALILIGSQWLGGKNDLPRIFDDQDYVRQEVRGSLKKFVVPVLVDYAKMPEPQQLPQDIRDLALRNAAPLRHERFDDDVENIFGVLFRTEKKRAWERQSSLKLKLLRSVFGVILSWGLLLCIALVHHAIAAQSLNQTIGNEPTVLLIVLISLLGAVGGFFFDSLPRAAPKATR